MALSALPSYQEGTWTPTDASGAALSLTVSVAHYTKIGRLVFLRAVLTYPVTANASVALIGGLPFTSASTQQILSIDANGAVAITAGYVAGSSTTMDMRTGQSNQVTNANMSSATLTISGCYEVA